MVQEIPVCGGDLCFIFPEGDRIQEILLQRIPVFKNIIHPCDQEIFLKGFGDEVLRSTFDAFEFDVGGSGGR